MESSDYHSSENSISYIALAPLASVGVNGGVVTHTLPDGGVESTPLAGERGVELAINSFLGRFEVEGEESDCCGLYGYTTFNAVKYFENIEIKESRDEVNDAPDILYILFRYILVSTR